MCDCPTAKLFPHRGSKCALKNMFNTVNAEIDAEEARKAEIARQTEIARQIEEARQARKKDLTNQLNQAEAKVLRLQKELIATTENVSKLQAELATM